MRQAFNLYCIKSLMLRCAVLYNICFSYCVCYEQAYRAWLAHYMYILHQGTPPILQIHCSKPHTIYGCYFTEEKCIKPTVKVRRELTPEHTGNLLSLEKSLLSQLLDLLAACKKSKQVVSTTTRVATTKPTTVLVDATTTPGEITCIWFDNQWGRGAMVYWWVPVHPSFRTGWKWNMCFFWLSSS